MTTITEETKYRTSDDRLFGTKSDAENHQFDLDHEENIWWLPSNLKCEAQYDDHHHNAKPLSTHELAQLLLAHPDMIAMTYDGMRIDRVKTAAHGGKMYAQIGEARP